MGRAIVRGRDRQIGRERGEANKERKKNRQIATHRQRERKISEGKVKERNAKNWEQC